MNEDDNAGEQPLAWTAALQDTPVTTTDGITVGTLHEVVGSRDDDIFHGIVVSVNSKPHEVLVPATQVTEITDRRLTISMDADQVRALPAFQSADSFELGFSGLLGRLGWVREGDNRS